MKSGLTIWDEAEGRHRDVSDAFPLPVGGAPVEVTGTLTQAGDTVVLELGGRSMVTMQLVDEQFNFNGSAYPEFSIDGGTFWRPATWTGELDWFAGEVPVDGGAIDASDFLYPGQFVLHVPAGATHVRVRMDAPANVPITVTLRATAVGEQRLRMVVPVHSPAAPRLNGDGVYASSVTTFRRLRTARPTITTTDPAYAAGDCIGGKLTLQPALGMTTGAPVVLRHVALKDDKNQKPELQLLFFKSNPAGTYTDNQPVVVTTADMGALLAMVPVTAADWKTIQGTTKAVAQVALPHPIVVDADSDTYLVIVTVSTPDYGANSTDLTLNTAWEQATQG